jgi:hypothetical protein
MPEHLETVNGAHEFPHAGARVHPDHWRGFRTARWSLWLAGSSRQKQTTNAGVPVPRRNQQPHAIVSLFFAGDAFHSNFPQNCSHASHLLFPFVSGHAAEIKFVTNNLRVPAA